MASKHGQAFIHSHGSMIPVAVQVGREVAVSADHGVGELFAELLQQKEQRRLLFLGAGIFGLAVGVQSSDVADADAVGVAALHMGPDLGDVAALADRTVKQDHVVVADLSESPLTVPAVDVFDAERHPLFGCAAMQHDVLDFTHVVEYWISIYAVPGGRRGRSPLPAGIRY